MDPQSNETKLIECLNTLIKMAQWDKSLPLYFACLFKEPDQYKNALQLLRNAPKDVPPPPSVGDALTDEEWQEFFQITTCAPPLREMFAGEGDPFAGASPSEISLLAEVSDLTTDTQTMFYSRNGTFHLVLDAVRQRAELDTKEVIRDALTKFYTLFDAKKHVAEQLYKLACTNDWFSVLASLKDARDYTSDESATARATLKEWNEKLITELGPIQLKPKDLFRLPKKLVKLAWERQDLFEKAHNSIPKGQRSSVKLELSQQVANVVYPLFVKEAKSEIEAIESGLQLLAVVARHYISVRKFVKLDGLVYTWPRVASLAMANYPNLEYVEDFFVERKPRPSDAELEARDARELYELCESNPALIRFLRLKPHFKDIDENELRRYRPLAPVTISDPTQATTSATIQSPSGPATPVTPSVTPHTRVCELVITEIAPPLPEFNFEIVLKVSNKQFGRAKIPSSVPELLDRTLNAIGVISEDSLQSIMKELFSGTQGEQVLLRGGQQLFNLTLGLIEEPIASAFESKQAVRLIVASEVEDAHYLPWEWLPRPGQRELLLSQAKFSLVRAKAIRSNISLPPLLPPIRLMGLFPNAPLGTRDISDSSIKAMKKVTSDGARYQSLERDEATWDTVESELKKFGPQILHFEGSVSFLPEPLAGPTIFFSSKTGTPEAAPLKPFAASLVENGVQLVVIGRNESWRTYGNPVAALSNRLIQLGVPAVLAPVRAVDDVTATSLTSKFYEAFLAGNSFEQAFYIARRKVAGSGGDWTAFALFANPSVLDFLLMHKMS